MLDRILTMSVILGVSTWAVTHWAFDGMGFDKPMRIVNNASSTASGLANSIAIAPSRHGHYLVTAAINGRSVDFLIDSGATDIVLSAQDARHVGINPRALRYTDPVSTANGVIRVAPVSLRELRIGQLQVRDIAAKVNPAPMTISLLGMRFLNTLDGWEVRNGTLTLYW